MAIQRYEHGSALTQERAPGANDRFVSQSAAPEELGHYLGALRKRWWLVAGMIAVSLVLAWWMQRDAIPQYTAAALLQHQTEAPVMADRVFGTRYEDFSSHLEIMRSRSVLRDVVDSLDLQLNPVDRRGERSRLFAFAEVGPQTRGGLYSLQRRDEGLTLENENTGQRIGTFSPSDTIEGPGFRLKLAPSVSLEEPLRLSITDVERATQSLQGRLSIEPGTGSDLIWVRVTDPDPLHAANLVNAVASRYREFRADRARQMASRRREVIADQLVQLADSLETVQDRVLDYQRQEELLNPQAEGNALLSERMTVESELRGLRFQASMLETLVAELQTTGPSDELQQRLLGLGNGVIPGGENLQRRLQSLTDERRELTASRFGYTENAPQVQALDAQIEAVKGQMQVAAEQSLRMLRARMDNTQSRLGQVRVGVGTAPSVTADYSRLQQRVDAVQSVYDALVDEYYEAQITENVEAGDVAVVDRATVPLYPDTSGMPLRMALALMAGFMVGAVGAITLDRFDQSVSSAPEVERAVRIPVLGTVPRIRSRGSEAMEMRVGKEAFRSLRTSLMFALPNEPKSLTITSAEPGEGKSTVAANLALALAEQGLEVVLVDGDLRRPRIHELFGIRYRPGLTDVIAGKANLLDTLWEHPTLRGLRILPGGTVMENATELIGGEAFAAALSELEAKFDIVLIDTAPVLAFADASLISVVSDGTVVVARAERTNQDALRDAVERLRRINASLVGIVLNATPIDDASAYYYEYYDADRRRPPRRARLTGSGTVS